MHSSAVKLKSNKYVSGCKAQKRKRGNRTQKEMLKHPGLDEDEVPVVEPGEGGLAVAHLLRV